MIKDMLTKSKNGLKHIQLVTHLIKMNFYPILILKFGFKKIVISSNIEIIQLIWFEKN